MHILYYFYFSQFKFDYILGMAPWHQQVITFLSSSTNIRCYHVFEWYKTQKYFKRNIVLLYIHNYTDILIFRYFVSLFFPCKTWIAWRLVNDETLKSSVLGKIMESFKTSWIRHQSDILVVKAKRRFGPWTVNHIKSRFKIYNLMQNICFASLKDDQMLEIQFFSTFRFFTLSQKGPLSPLCAY